jgi:hypothetical protein
MNFNLGNFGGQLQLEDVNGALRNTGSTFQFDPQQAQGGIQAPAAPSAPQATGPAIPGQQPQEEKKQGGMGSILGLVGQFMGGAYGAALQGAGSLMGGQK